MFDSNPVCRPRSWVIFAAFLFTVWVTPAHAQSSPAAGDPDPYFHYPLPAALEPDSTNLVAVENGYIVVHSVMPDAGADTSVIELTRIDLDGRPVPTYGTNGRLRITVPAAVNVADAAVKVDDQLLLGGQLRLATGALVAVLVLIDADGHLVAGFGDNGVLAIDVPGDKDRIADLLPYSYFQQWPVHIAVWSRLSVPATGCATDRATSMVLSAPDAVPEELFAEQRSSFLSSCRAVIGLGSFSDQMDDYQTLFGTQLGIYEVSGARRTPTGYFFGPFFGTYMDFRYIGLNSSEIGYFIGPAGTAPDDGWVGDPSLGRGEPTSWQRLRYPFAAYATDGGRVSIVRFTDGLAMPWRDVEAAGRDGVRATEGLANDVRYFGSDATGGLVVATADGVVRRYITSPETLVLGGLLYLRTPYNPVERRRQLVTLQVDRVGYAEGSVSVRYEVGGGCVAPCGGYLTATAGKDFSATNGELTWAAGDRAPKYFDIEILEPQELQPAEAIPVRIHDATGEARIVSPQLIVVLASGGSGGAGSGGGGSGSGGNGSGSGGGSPGSSHGGGSGDWLLLCLVAGLAWCRDVRPRAA